MDNIINNNKRTNRLAKNIIYLYIRMFFGLLVALYTSRVILDVLGIEDFGVFNVVGGLITMFGMFSASFAYSVQRFLTFALGENNIKKTKAIFSTSVTIHLVLAFLIFILAETVGIWFLNNKLVIPLNRLYAANWLFQYTLLTFIVSLISIPYYALIIAHEHMKVYSILGILEIFLRLGIVFFLMYLNSDKLILYGILLFLVSLIIRLSYYIYCKVRFDEAKYKFIFDISLLKEMGIFIGWNFFGATSGILQSQGVNIVINIFCGPMINAARGISVQINSAVTQFTRNFMVALNPQITKSYASNQITYMHTLIIKGSKFSCFLMILISTPILLNTDFVLSKWLVKVPDHATSFVQLMLVYNIIETICNPLATGLQSTGKIKYYLISVSAVRMLSLPLSYVLLSLGVFPEITIIIYSILSIVRLLLNLYFAKSMIALSVSNFSRKVLLRVFFVILLLLIPLLFNCHFHANSLFDFIKISILSLIYTSSIMFLFGFTISERSFLKNKIFNKST